MIYVLRDELSFLLKELGFIEVTLEDHVEVFLVERLNDSISQVQWVVVLIDIIPIRFTENRKVVGVELLTFDFLVDVLVLEIEHRHHLFIYVFEQKLIVLFTSFKRFFSFNSFDTIH